MIRRPPRSTLSSSSAASDVYKRQYQRRVRGGRRSAMPPQKGTTQRCKTCGKPRKTHCLCAKKVKDRKRVASIRSFCGTAQAQEPPPAARQSETPWNHSQASAGPIRSPLTGAAQAQEPTAAARQSALPRDHSQASAHPVSSPAAGAAPTTAAAPAAGAALGLVCAECRGLRCATHTPNQPIFSNLSN
eukprot:TRINITY_DN7912_c0_g1_i2.p1 TRINITY_DN7912_c0_g1~~TRINITY_DN7912_c0_g1_i2.p1  ORF type:complete len:188 (-),score=26.09 TRINITY_DN7912_c0_g1_i2:603-1166(-)